jgi:hypothetical protein
LAGLANSRASSRRLRSPPDSELTGERPLGREQEVLEIADHVLARTADFDEVGARRDDIDQRWNPG